MFVRTVPFTGQNLGLASDVSVKHSQFFHEQKWIFAIPPRLPSILTMLVFCLLTIAIFSKGNTVFWSSLPLLQKDSILLWLCTFLDKTPEGKEDVFIYISKYNVSSLHIFFHSNSSSHPAALSTKHILYTDTWMYCMVHELGQLAFSHSALMTQCYWRYLLTFPLLVLDNSETTLLVLLSLTKVIQRKHISIAEI